MTTKIEYMKAVYMCDTCKGRFHNKEDADDCQKSHSCDHAKFTYEIDGYKVIKNCAGCSKELSVLGISGDELTQTEMETIYKIMDGTYV
jgi:hypothetical protein